MKALLATSRRSPARSTARTARARVSSTLTPVPKSNCTITIEGSATAANAEIVLQRGVSGVERRQPLGSQPAVIELEPDDYLVSLWLNNVAAETATSMPIDLYDHRSIAFKPAAAASGSILESIARPKIHPLERAHRGAARCYVRHPQHQHRR